ncbi:MAG TPA: CoA transferase, partial [Tepidiformaceae bacterium]
NPEWVAKAEAKVAEVEATIRSKKTAEWMVIFDREGVPASPVNFTEDLINDPQVLANDMMVDLEHDLSGPQRQVGPLLDFSLTPLEAQGASPPIDRDTNEVLRGGGYTDAQIADLRSRGVVGCP